MTKPEQQPSPLPTPDALRRVNVAYDRDQQEAAKFAVSYTARQDTVALTLNPDLAPPESIEAYKIKGAVMAMLEGFARYRRAVTRELGTRLSHEALYFEAVDKAMYEAQQLIHLTPGLGQVPRLGQTSTVPQPAPVNLPDGLPWVAFLRAGGVMTDQQLAEATDAELLNLLTPGQLGEVRAALGQPAAPSTQPQAPSAVQQAQAAQQPAEAPALAAQAAAAPLTSPEQPQATPELSTVERARLGQQGDPGSSTSTPEEQQQPSTPEPEQGA